LAFFHPAHETNTELLVCNNVLDALTAATLHHPAVAILAGMEIHPATIEALHQLTPDYNLRICFPNNTREQQTQTILCALLANASPGVLELPSHAHNLNHWHRTKP
jgi:hypothetical protein